MCECDLCQRHKLTREIIESRDVDRLIERLNELEDNLDHAEMDVDYYEAIFDGSWPSSKEILLRALSKIG